MPCPHCAQIHSDIKSSLNLSVPSAFLCELCVQSFSDKAHTPHRNRRINKVCRPDRYNPTTYMHGFPFVV
jgi:transposase-like protein